MSDEFDTLVRCLSAFGASSTGFGPATTEAHVEVAIAKHVPLAVFFWNPPEERWMRKLKRAGIKVWGTAYSVESARRLKMLEADAVIVQSQEAGGHVKSDLGVRRYETGDIQARRSAADRTRRKLRVAPV